MEIGLQLKVRASHETPLKVNTRSWKWRQRSSENIQANMRRIGKLTAPPKPDKCDVCRRLLSSHEFHYDHDHKTGEFRGWLCRGCNVALGMARDNPTILRALADYLEIKR